MNRFLRWSVNAYRCVMIIYPEQLCREFGAEIIEEFEQDLSSECVEHGVKGAIRVWGVTLREIIHIGLPAVARMPAVIVSVLSAATAVILQSPLLIVAIRREGTPGFGPGGTSPQDIVFALAIGGAITALTALVAANQWERAKLISLGIH